MTTVEAVREGEERRGAIDSRKKRGEEGERRNASGDGLEGKRGQGKKRRARADKQIFVVVVVLHSSVMESLQSSACVGGVATDSD